MGGGQQQCPPCVGGVRELGGGEQTVLDPRDSFPFVAPSLRKTGP